MLDPLPEGSEISQLFLDHAPVPAFAQVEAPLAAGARAIIPTPVQSVMHKNISMPLDIKPSPGQVNVEQLRADAKARRDLQPR